MPINALMQGLVRRIERARGLDPIAKEASGSVSAATRPAPIKNLLSGSWLGHQLHPILTDLPIGAWGAATALDLTAGEEGAAAARRLVGMGLLTSAPTALAGASDWAETTGKDRRVGLVHGLMNAGVSVLQAGSWIARRRGHRGAGVALSLVAVTVAGVSAYLGGHLSYVRGIGVNRTAFQRRAREWTDVGAESEVGEGELRRVLVDDVPVLLTRRHGSLQAISAVCSHAGGPLDEGTLDEDGCVTCPWHGSRFRLADGGVERGPASVPQPSWEVRTDAGRVLLRAA